MDSLNSISKILQDNKRFFREKYNVTEIGIFGSYARKRQKKKRDIDILVEFEKAPDLFTFLKLERHLESLLHTKVDLVRKKALRPQLKDHILSEVIYL